MKSLVVGTLIGLLLSAGWLDVPAARAEEIIPVNCDDGVQGLKQAIDKANDKTTNPGLDTISLEEACIYSLTTADNSNPFLGPTGLPLITDPLIIDGNGATIERRPQATEQFRILSTLAANLTLRNLTIQNGIGLNSGGGVAADRDLTLVNVIVRGNRARSKGGGIYARGTTTVTGGRFENNHAEDSSGGAVFADMGNLTISKVKFFENKAVYGGAVYVGSGGAVTITDSIFEANEAVASGGGLDVSNNDTTIINTEFINNTAKRHGGGVNKGAVSFELTVKDNSRFVGNKAETGNGGGLYSHGPVVVTNSHFENNHAEHSGGGLYAHSTIDLSRSTLISNSTRATGSGLFIEQQNGGASNIVNNLWIGNHNTTGAGYTLSLLFDVDSQGSVNVWHNTFAQPGLTQERGILAAKAGVTLADNIITNFDVGLLGGEGVVSNYNLFAGNAQNILGSASSDNDLNVELPRFIDPANGDYHLRPGSPAIDAGLDVSVSLDLDGTVRPQGERPDIGAYEFGSTPSPGGCSGALDLPGGGRLTCLTGASDTNRDSHAPTISADGSKIVFHSDSDFLNQGIPDEQNEIWLYDVASGQLRRITTSEQDRDSFFPTISADGRKIVFHSNADFLNQNIPASQSEIWLYDVASGQLRRITTSEQNRDSLSPVISADGSKIVFHSEAALGGEDVPTDQFEIWLYDVDRDQLRRVTTSGSGRYSYSPAISESGSKIAFASNADFQGEGIPASQSEIWLYDVASSQLRRITTSGSGRGSYSPAISANGSKIVFRSNADFKGEGIAENQFEIWLYDVNSGQLSRITTASTPSGNSEHPAINEDGSKIVFQSNVDFKGDGAAKNEDEIWLYDVDSRQLRQITTSGPDRDSFAPAISESGSKIVFRSNADFLGLGTSQSEIWLFEDHPATPGPNPNPVEGVTVFLPLVVK